MATLIRVSCLPRFRTQLSHRFASSRNFSLGAITRLPTLASTLILDSSVDRVFTTFDPIPYIAPPRSRRVVNDVSPTVWAGFRDKYGEHRRFEGMAFEYDETKGQITAVRLSEPLRDIVSKVMRTQIYTRMREAKLDTQSRIDSLVVTRKFLQSSANESRGKRKPDCVVWTSDYESGMEPTIVLGVIFNQRPYPEARAIEWYNRYHGKVQVIIIARYFNNNPNTLLLEVFRRLPSVYDPNNSALLLRPNMPCYRAFQAVLYVTNEHIQSIPTSIPLTYRDYFGVGNVGTGIDPRSRFDLPLDLIKQEVKLVVATQLREQFYAAKYSGASAENLPQLPSG